MIICCRRGSHSKYLAGHFVYPSPRSDTAGFLAELERIAREHEIDVVVPAFEEAFYISTQLERLSRVTKVFVSPFGTLARRALFATVRFCSRTKAATRGSPSTRAQGSTITGLSTHDRRRVANPHMQARPPRGPVAMQKRHRERLNRQCIRPDGPPRPISGRSLVGDCERAQGPRDR